MYSVFGYKMVTVSLFDVAFCELKVLFSIKPTHVCVLVLYQLKVIPKERSFKLVI